MHSTATATFESVLCSVSCYAMGLKKVHSPDDSERESHPKNGVQYPQPWLVTGTEHFSHLQVPDDSIRTYDISSVNVTIAAW